MGKFFGYLLAAFVLLLGTIIVFLNYFAAPELKKYIENDGSKTLGTPIKVESVNVALWPFFGIIASNIQIKALPKNMGSLSVKQVNGGIQVSKVLSGDAFFTIYIGGANADLVLPEKKSVTPVYNASTQTSHAKIPDLEQYKSWLKVPVKLIVEDTNINLTDGKESFSVSDISTTANISSIDNLVIQGNFNMKPSPESAMGSVVTEIPVRYGFPLALHGQRLEVNQGQVEVWGMGLKTIGAVDLSTMLSSWEIKLDMPDLGQIPAGVLPGGKWTGALKSDVHLEMRPEIFAKGHLTAQNLKGDLNLQNQKLSATGQLSANADLDFNFDKVLSFSHITASSDMQGLALSFADQFKKPVGIAMGFEINAAEANNVLEIKNAKADFANLNISMTGKLAALKGQNSNLAIILPKTSLNGLEKYFPPLSGQPLTGEIEAKAEVFGDLQNPENLSLTVDPISLKNVQAAVNWQSPDKKKSVKGPARINAKAVVKTKGKNLATANILAQADLTSMTMDMGEMFQQKPGWPLRINLDARQKGQQLEFKSSTVNTLAGQLTIQGSVKQPQRPILNLKLSVPKLNLSELSKMIPLMASYHVAGSASSNLSVSGTYDFAKGVTESPLRISGSLNAQLPEFNYVTTKKTEAQALSYAKSESVVAPKAKESETFAPNWPVIRDMGLSTSLSIGQVKFNDLAMSGLSLKGNLKNGELTGQAQVRSIFDGSVNATDINVSLLKPLATTTLKVQARSIDMQKTVAWVSPEWKDLVKGSLTGQVNLSVPYPTRTDFIDATNAQGVVTITNGFLSSLPFDSLVNDKLAAIPGVGKQKPVSTKGATANIDSVFSFSNSKLNLTRLHLITPEKNELESKGVVKLDKTMDLVGTVYLSDPPVSGSFREANSDASGRLVVPDLHVSGSCFKPSVDVAQGTIQQMISKTASYEANKLKAKVQGDVQDKLKQEGQKKLQELFGH